MDRDERVGRPVAVLIVLAAALARLHGLGRLPLSPVEASNAAIAWDIARGAGAPDATDPAWSAVSPLLGSAQFLLFGLFGAADEGLARVPSALAGIVLVLCPWALRSRLGTPAALLLSALIALDPMSVAASRRAEAAELAVALGAVILVAAHRRAWSAAAAALGLLLVAGEAAFTVAPVVVLAGVLARDPRPAGPRLRRLALLGAAAALAGATGLLGAWGLAGGLSAGISAWLAAWSRPTALAGLGEAAHLANPLALVLGIAGLACLARQRRFGVVAALGACLWWSARSAPLLALLVIAAAAPAVQEMQRRRTDPSGAPLRAAWVGAILGAVALAGIARTVGIAAGDLDTVPASAAGVGLLVRDVERLSSERAGDPHELPVDVVCQPWPDPMLRWALRGTRQVRFHAGSPDPRDRGPALVIGPEPSVAGEAPCAVPPGSSGARYQAGPARLVLWVPRAG